MAARKPPRGAVDGMPLGQDPYGDCSACGYPRWRKVGHTDWCWVADPTKPPPRQLSFKELVERGIYSK